jgi:LCP family protein required for cell wall assembly
LLLVLAIALFFVLGAFACLAMRQAGLLPPEPGSVAQAAPTPTPALGRTNILILGSTSTPERADVVMVASLDPKGSRVHVLSIPRNTRVHVPGRSAPERLQEAMALGGPELTRQAVSEFLRVPLDHWMDVRLDGLVAAVDALGGVELDVPHRMYYRDHAGHFTISLHPGHQLLSGDKAQEFVRFRRDSAGEVGRVQRQQAFLLAAFARAVDPATLPKLPLVIDTLRRSVASDMSAGDWIRYAAWAQKVSPRAIRAEVIPGAESPHGAANPDWVASDDEMRQLATSLLTDQAAAIAHGRPVVVDAKTKLDTRISILNGTRRTLLGNEAARVLREAGWTVWEVGTAAHHDASATVIAGHSEDPGVTAAIAGTLGLPLRVAPNGHDDGAADVTVILGEDFASALRDQRAKGR